MNRTRQLTLTALFAALTAVLSQISFPIPFTPIVFTMGVMAVYLTAALLPKWNALLAQLVYLLLGAVGLPVFSGFSGGIGRFAGVTGGYLIGFLLIPLVMWGAQTLFGKGPVVFVLSAVVGLAVCYAFGTAWFVLMYAATSGPIGVVSALWSCVIPFLIPDALKLALALVLSRRLAPVMAKAMA